ncbi:hypothetical protein BJ508DRAFT_410047 [Ascobolus immersus RN42]|uniref:Mitochondrial-processing peptidase subunit alpha n=1 Tax=Ascobolus immersus RN42 TaxID=1160509 RepID=A0A3N4IPR1_ASCIM|nr:hypothetical protein BJ508DRAFT_410047 [Ascobolus immersus RN42]
MYRLSRLSRSLPRKLSTPKRTFVTIPKARDTVELDNLTTLPNGVRVATEALPGHFSGVGVYVDAGSRYEGERLSGVSHIMDRLAFKSTSRRTADEMLQTAEGLGGNLSCGSTRESIMYQAAVFNHQVEDMTALLAETVREPLITDEEVFQQLETADYEISEIWAKPELILPELIHQVGYSNQTLGAPLLCPRERLGVIDASLVREYRAALYRPERIVLAFAGVDHNTAVKLAEKYYGDMTGTPMPPSVDTRVAHYTGGTMALPAPATPSYLQPLTHLHLAFESATIVSEDLYALATLQTLLGGGGSFSAGGPGKGMYSRLYTNVLNQFGWIESCVAFNHSFTDSGLFGIAASCQPNAGHALVDVVMKEFHATYNRVHGLTKEEVDRAKNQLRSALLMNLESRMVELEDLGRQVQTYGRKTSAQEMGDKIQALTVDDIKKVAKKVLTGKIENPGQGTGQLTAVVMANGKGEEERMLTAIENAKERLKLSRL